MGQLKVGDRVICTESFVCLTPGFCIHKGYYYTVSKLLGNRVCLEGYGYLSYDISLFELVKEEKVMREFEIGDDVIITATREEMARRNFYDGGLDKGDRGVIIDIHDSVSVKLDVDKGSCSWIDKEQVKLVHPWHDVVIAWLRGEQIQEQVEGVWEDWRTNSFKTTPLFSNGNKWRVKPEKNPQQEEIENIEEEMRKLADRLEELRKSNG